MRVFAHCSAALLGAFMIFGALGCGPVEETAADAGPDSSSGCSLGFLGDPALDPEIELISLGAEGVSAPIADGSSVALIFPPQGGRVIFAGVRATNVSACGVTLGGSLRDPQNGKICFDERTVNLQPLGDGWGASVDSNISTFSNIPVCPNQWSMSDAFGSEFDLTVKLRDKEGRTAEKTVRVVPACAEPENEAQCLCICKQGYVLGEMCASPPASP
ncbi:MAG: hypothetical protein HUU21_10580 [Polyangiaceae bacterium]|nr:hypothetical protein [Polyangiaceae bacterium]